MCLGSIGEKSLCHTSATDEDTVMVWRFEMNAMLKRLTVVNAIILVTALALITAARADTIYDKDMHVVDYADLEFPAIAVTAHVEGVVVVRVSLDDKGKVVDVEALSGPSLLTRQSLQNAKKWRFEPNPQKAAIIVYDFRIEGACHATRVGGSASQMIFFPPNFVKITACPTPLMTMTNRSESR
ncbi:MAG: TonB family protein [Candidatus Micrarchaeaceae archaeon]